MAKACGVKGLLSSLVSVIEWLPPEDKVPWLNWSNNSSKDNLTRCEFVNCRANKCDYRMSTQAHARNCWRTSQTSFPRLYIPGQNYLSVVIDTISRQNSSLVQLHGAVSFLKILFCFHSLFMLSFFSFSSLIQKKYLTFRINRNNNK